MRSLFTTYTDFNFDTVESNGFIKTKQKYLTVNEIKKQIQTGEYVNLYWVDYDTDEETRIMHITVQMRIFDSHTTIINMPETPEEVNKEMNVCSTMTCMDPVPDDAKQPLDVLGKRIKIGDTIICQSKKHHVQSLTYMGIPNRENAKKFDDDGWYINDNIPLYLCMIFTEKLDNTITTLLWYRHKIPFKLFNRLYSQRSFDTFQDILFDEKEIISDGIYLDLQNALKRDHF